MKKNKGSCLSFIIQTDGEIVPVVPDGEEFSPEQICLYVAGPAELFCRTHDGFLLFHNKEAKVRGLQTNDLATAMYLRRTRAGELAGCVFVTHPEHVPAAWKRMVADRLQDLALRAQMVC